MDVLIEAGKLALMVGPIGGLAWLLNRRDRRQARLLRAVAGAIGSRELAGRVGVEVRCGLFRPGCRVALHMLADSGEEILDVVGRLSRGLSPRVRLTVDGSVGRDRPLAFAVATRIG